ncbi:MAG: Ig-like domain-containing protein [Mycobacterium kyogaense]|uniref:Ig-like domain-containing protein n=1 Tax=Mycobacterium kyogaense TaxID=2212479 RepID=UPI002FF5C992
MSAVSASVRLGLASAGVGAGLLGFALLGPEIGSAAADSGETSVSASAGEKAGPSSPREARRAARAERTEKAEARKQRVADKRRADTDADTDAEVASDEPAESPRKARQERAAAAINQMTAAALERIDDRPISDERKEQLEKRLATTRRTFFNQAPTVNPVQVTGVMDGPISGTIGAEDPDGDRLRYRLVKGPSTGSVTVDKDGSYTYTPGEGFTGVDTFVVAARDLGLHVNLLNWFRPGATRAESVINHRAITYDFTWVGDEWTPDRKAAFQRSADYIAGFLVVRTPIVLSYELTAINDPDYLVNADTLAAFTEPPGLLQTSIQHEVLTGVDVEDGAIQAFMNWNFAWKWATGDVVADDEYDFQNTARHELLHSFGMYSLASSDLSYWSVYDSFLTTADGTSLFGADGKLRPDAQDYLDGLNGGAYFGGAHAIAAYGGKPIPLSKSGSPSHLDRFVFSGDDFKLMNDKSPGPGWHDVRYISPIEYGILQDIGFTLRPAPIS